MNNFTSRTSIIEHARRRYLFAVFMNRSDILAKAVRVFRRLAAR